MRWSRGRFDVLKLYGPALLVQGLRTGNLRCLDAALPLVFPNPSLGINLTLLGLAAASLAAIGGAGGAAATWFATLAVAQLGMLIVAVFHTKHKAASAASLVLAPLFLVWKMGIDILSVFGIGKQEWKQSHRRAS
jgi:hypothetical protein